MLSPGWDWFPDYDNCLYAISSWEGILASVSQSVLDHRVGAAAATAVFLTLFSLCINWKMFKLPKDAVQCLPAPSSVRFPWRCSVCLSLCL